MKSIYSHLLIYYFSGTGNAKQAAEWIVEVARQKGVNARLINIDRFREVDFPPVEGRTLIGFCSPTHGFNLPPIMLKFILKFPKIKQNDVFILNTRAGMKMSKLFLPGLSGMAQIYAALVLIIKGYRVRGMQPLDLPSNWISLHPGLKQKVVDSIFGRHERITKKFAERILFGGSKYKALLSLPIDILLFPIAIGYYFIGRFAIAKTFFADNNCTRCRLCEKQCPVNAIKMIQGRPYWTFKCESCMRCMNNCPERAIQTSHTYSIGIWFLFASFFMPWLFGKFYNYDFIHINTNSWLANRIEDVILWGVGLLLIFLFYRLCHYLLKFRFFNNLIAYTSFTKYKFWRRYKGVRSKKVIGDRYSVISSWDGLNL
jgi:Pyruvate/2-oxoacid:ferredoxin oxidoreductase delta subunit